MKAGAVVANPGGTLTSAIDRWLIISPSEAFFAANQRDIVHSYLVEPDCVFVHLRLPYHVVSGRPALLPPNMRRTVFFVSDGTGIALTQSISPCNTTMVRALSITMRRMSF